MKKYVFILALAVVMLFTFTACGSDDDSPATAATAAAGWFDLGALHIPPTWTFHGEDLGSGPRVIEIFGEGENGPIRMDVWSVMAGDPAMIVNEFASQEAFTFDDGSRGYMLKEHTFQSDTLVMWLHPDSWVALSLFYDGDDSVFTDNEELLLRVAQTLRAFEETT